MILFVEYICCEIYPFPGLRIYMFERVERAVKKFEAENFMVKQATEDADALIINTAINVSSAFDFVIVVGYPFDDEV
jgi:hypothetical protein